LSEVLAMTTDAETPTGLLLSDDLLFASRIAGTARGLKLTIHQATSVNRLTALVQSHRPRLVILDLANPTLDLPTLIAELESTAGTRPRLVAYGSHVDGATLRKAKEAGCEVVLARSQFIEELPQALPAWMAP
jgi:CheY-like chemotaxis protein